MSTHELRDKLDGIHALGRMEAVYPEGLSRLHKGVTANLLEIIPQDFKRKTKRNMDRRGRFRTQPITFTEIQEVDEESTDLQTGAKGIPGVNVTNDESSDTNTMLKARSEMNLKFSDYSPSPTRKTRKNRLDLPKYSPPPPCRWREDVTPESPSEEAETTDHVCRLVAPLLIVGPASSLIRNSPDIEFPVPAKCHSQL